MKSTKGGDEITVEEVRQKLGLSQPEMAELLGISMRTYCYRITDKQDWRFAELAAIADNCDSELLLKSGSSFYRVSIQKVG